MDVVGFREGSSPAMIALGTAAYGLGIHEASAAEPLGSPAIDLIDRVASWTEVVVEAIGIDTEPKGIHPTWAGCSRTMRCYLNVECPWSQ